MIVGQGRLRRGGHMLPVFGGGGGGGAAFLQPANRLFLPAIGDSRPAQDLGHSGGPVGTAQTTDRMSQQGITSWMHLYNGGQTRQQQSPTLGIGGETPQDTLLVPRPIFARTTFRASIDVDGNMTITSFSRADSMSLAVGQLLGSSTTGLIPYGVKLVSGSGNNWVVSGLNGVAVVSTAGMYVGDPNIDMVAVAKSVAKNAVIMIGTNAPADADLLSGSALQTQYRKAILALTDPTQPYPGYRPIGTSGADQPLPLSGGVPMNLWLIDEEPQGVDAVNTVTGARSVGRVTALNTGWVPFVRGFDAVTGGADKNPRVTVIKLWDDPRFYDVNSGSLFQNLPGLLADGKHSTPAGAAVIGGMISEKYLARVTPGTSFLNIPTAATASSFINPNPMFTGSGGVPGGAGIVIGTPPASTSLNGKNAGLTYTLTTSFGGGPDGEFSLRITGTPTGTAATSVLIFDAVQTLTTAMLAGINLATDSVRMSFLYKVAIAAGDIVSVQFKLAIQTAPVNLNSLVNATTLSDGLAYFYDGSNATTRANTPMRIKYPQYTSPSGTVYQANTEHDYLPFMSTTMDFSQYGLTGAPDNGTVGMSCYAMAGVPLDITVGIKTLGLAKATN